jgi:hypothetical protein
VLGALFVAALVVVGGGAIARPSWAQDETPAPRVPATPKAVLLNASIDGQYRQLIVAIKHEDDTPFPNSTDNAANLNANLIDRSNVLFPNREINQVPRPAINLPIDLLSKEGNFPKIWYLNDRKIALLFFGIPTVSDFEERLGDLGGDDTVFNIKLLEGTTSLPPIPVSKRKISAIDPCPPDPPAGGGPAGNTPGGT